MESLNCLSIAAQLHPLECLPTCLQWLSAKWSQESLVNTYNLLTNTNTKPIHLYVSSPKELKFLNLGSTLQTQIYSLFTRGTPSTLLDIYELFTVLILCTRSINLQERLHTLFYIIGNIEEDTITQEQFSYLMDCLFAGLAKTLITIAP